MPAVKTRLPVTLSLALSLASMVTASIVTLGGSIPAQALTDPNDARFAAEIEELVVEGEPQKNLAGLIAKAFGAFEAQQYALARQQFDVAQDAMAASIARRDPLNISLGIGIIAPASGSRSLAGQGTLGRGDSVQLSYLLYMRGQSELKLGDYEAANRSLRQALSNNHRLHQARAELVYLYALDGEEKKARRHLKKLHAIIKDCHGDCGIDAGLEARIALAENAVDEKFSGWAPYSLD